MRWLRALFCWFGQCMRCRTAEDERGIWGQCIDCGRRHGYVDRATLRAYIDRELAERLRESPAARALREELERDREQARWEAQSDALHPDGRCTCAGEWRCAWCKAHCIHCGARAEMHDDLADHVFMAPSIWAE